MTPEWRSIPFFVVIFDISLKLPENSADQTFRSEEKRTGFTYYSRSNPQQSVEKPDGKAGRKSAGSDVCAAGNEEVF